MSDATQNADLAPEAEEAGDGGANIDSQAAEDSEAQSLEGPDVEVSTSGNSADDSDGQAWGKSAENQAEGDFPIMS